MKELQKLTRRIIDIFANVGGRIETNTKDLQKKFLNEIGIKNEEVTDIQSKLQEINSELETIKEAYNNSCSDNKEDKIFELINKMYSDINSKFDEINKKLDLKSDKNDIIRIEDKLENNSKALFDGYKQAYEKLKVIDNKLEDISTKVEKQDVEIRVIKNVANQ